MKRFMLFGYHAYYPYGGMNDFIDSFDDIKTMARYIGREMSSTQHIQIYDIIREYKIDNFYSLITKIDNYMQEDTVEYLENNKIFRPARCSTCFHNDAIYRSLGVDENNNIKLKCGWCGMESYKN